MNLKEVGRLIDCLERSDGLEKDVLLQVAKTSPTTFIKCCDEVLGGQDVSDESKARMVLEASHGDSKVSYIKAHRSLFGSGLLEAKEWVEQHMAGECL